MKTESRSQGHGPSVMTGPKCSRGICILAYSLCCTEEVILTDGTHVVPRYTKRCAAETFGLAAVVQKNQI